MNVLIVENDLKFANLLSSEFKKSDKVSNVTIVKSIDDLYVTKDDGYSELAVKEDITCYDLTIANIDLMKNTIDDLYYVGSKDYIGLSSNNKIITKYINSSNFTRVLKMPICIKDFVSYLNNQFHLFDENIEKIDDFNLVSKLSFLGFNVSHSGTHYLAEAIKLALNKNYHNISKLYEDLSSMFYTTTSSIKWAIYNSVNWAYNGDFEKKMDKFFKIYDGRKPTPKYIIDYFVTNLKNS